jgi:glutathione S-transferase
MLTLYFSAFSPYCRKVRMAMNFKGLDYTIHDSNDVAKIPAWNLRAEVPVLTDGDVTVRNSANILEYLDRKFPDKPVFPEDPAAFALAKEWELVADTMVDPIVTNLSLWKWANMNDKPEGLDKAAAASILPIYDQLQARLEAHDYIAGEISSADFALYPHITGANFVGLPFDKERHSHIGPWIKRMRNSKEGLADLKSIMEFWQTLPEQDVDRDRINWGTYRLEWFLAHGYHDWFLNEIKQDKVLWSVGPKNNAQNSPAAPKTA